MNESSNNEADLGFLAGRRIVVTGAAGFIGANLVERIRDVDCHVVRAHRPGSPPDPVVGAAQIEDVPADVREREAWERLVPAADVVFHFAAQTSARVADENPPVDMVSNVMPMRYMLETCVRLRSQPTILFASAVTVAGVTTSVPVDEDRPDRPVTAYDRHKLMAEQYLNKHVESGSVKGATLRLANVYGPGPESSRPDRGILNRMIRRAIAGQALTVYKPGDCVRDYVFVGDVVSAFLLACRDIDTVNGRRFVIGSGEGHTLAEAFNLVADRVALKTGRRAPVEYVDPPGPQSPIESRSFVADTRRFTQATGWRPRYRLAEGIDRTVESLL